MIPYARQAISEADIRAVVDVLRSDFLTQGPAVPRFESAFADRCKAQHALAFSNATSALHAACLSLGLGPGDRLWTSPNSFVASANCGRYCGATVDFVDIDPVTYNMSVEALREKLAIAARAGQLPKVLVPVHFAGQPCDLAGIAALARPHGIQILEDASHAVGAVYQGTPIGACQHADVAVFSFHAVKIITTGEGGIATTGDAALARRLASLRSHGITRERCAMTRQDQGGWYYEQTELGYNYRMTDIAAGLGTSQLARLDELLSKRRELAGRYDRLLAGLPVTRPQQAPGVHSAWHLYVIQLVLDRIGRSRAEVYEALRAAGIGVNVHYIPVHLQPYYRALGFKPGDFPHAERYSSRALTLPLYPELTDAQQDQVVSALQRALGMD